MPAILDTTIYGHSQITIVNYDVLVILIASKFVDDVRRQVGRALKVVNSANIVDKPLGRSGDRTAHPKQNGGLVVI